VYLERGIILIDFVDEDSRGLLARRTLRRESRGA
jgi:hypothetical protein